LLSRPKRSRNEAVEPYEEEEEEEEEEGEEEEESIWTGFMRLIIETSDRLL
jgi:hypothetical protein